MILPGDKIRELVQGQAEVCIEPFDPSSLEPASYDLTVGDQAASTGADGVVDVKEKGYFELRPGTFAIVTTREKITLDASHVARFGLTSSYARSGVVATTGLHVDPGFRGLLVVGLTNLSAKAVRFPHHDKFLSIEFHQLSEPAKHLYTGPYQGREGLGPEDIKTALDREVDSMPEMMETLRTLTAAVDGLKSGMRSLQWVMGVGVVVVVMILAVLLKGP